MPTITGWIAVADVSDGQTFTRYYSTASVGGSISTTQGSRKYFYDVIHNVSASPVAPTSLTVFNLLIGSDGADGNDGNDGSDAVRYAEVTLYTNPTVANAPSAPSATITWSTSAISSITSGWSQTPPTISASSSNSVYSSQLIFIDSTAPFTTTTVTGTTPIQSINFTGVVTFNSGDFIIGGSTITTIDGANINTGTITSDQINANAITGKNVTVGTLTNTNVPTGNLKGVRLQSDGTFIAGNAGEYLRWDGSELTVQGNIANINPNRISGFAGDWFGITAATSNFDITNILDTLGGAGIYSFLLVSGGGGGASYNGSGGLFGGGSGAAANFVYDWNGSTALTATVGDGGNGISGGQQGNGGNGSSSTFEIGGTTYVSITGGSGGSSGTSAGGVASFPNGTSIFPIQAEIRAGGAGGNGLLAYQQSATGGGGGGVDAFGIAADNSRTTSGANTGGSTAGGNCFGTSLGWLGDGTVVKGTNVLSTESPESLRYRGALFTGGQGGSSAANSGPGIGGGAGGTVAGGSSGNSSPGAAGGGSGALFITRL